MEWMRPAERWWPASSDSNNSSRETISPSAAGSGVRPGRTRLDGAPNTADQLKRLSKPWINLQSPTLETFLLTGRRRRGDAAQAMVWSE